MLCTKLTKKTLDPVSIGRTDHDHPAHADGVLQGEEAVHEGGLEEGLEGRRVRQEQDYAITIKK